MNRSCGWHEQNVEDYTWSPINGESRRHEFREVLRAALRAVPLASLGRLGRDLGRDLGRQLGRQLARGLGREGDGLELARRGLALHAVLLAHVLGAMHRRHPPRRPRRRALALALGRTRALGRALAL